jgi:aconitate decarboxylase
MSAAARQPTAPDGPTGQLATWIAGFTLDQAPAVVQERAKYLILDGIGCALVGAQLPWSRTGVEAVTAFEGGGGAPLIGWGTTTGPPAAAVLNGSFISGLELDDLHPLAPMHLNTLLLPALLSAASVAPGISGARFVGAAIAGYESGPRAGQALHGAQMLTRGWYSPGVFGTIASSAAAANLLGLDAAQTEDALGHGATLSFGLMGVQFGAMSQRMLGGLASRNGLYAAFLAKAGYTGIKQVFEQSYGGWLSTFGEGHDPDPAQITSELGERWETQRIAIKPYAANGATHAPIDALFEINATRPLKPGEIASIDAELNGTMYDHCWWPIKRPLSVTDAQMNIAYVLAVGVLDGEVLVGQFTPARIDQDDVWDLIPRVTAHHNKDFDTTTDPMRAGQTRVRVHFTDGTDLESYQQGPREVFSPLGNDEILTKYRHVTRDVIDPARQARLEQVIFTLDQQPSLDELTALLAPPAAPVFAETT